MQYLVLYAAFHILYAACVGTGLQGAESPQKLSQIVLGWHFIYGWKFSEFEDVACTWEVLVQGYGLQVILVVVLIHDYPAHAIFLTCRLHMPAWKTNRANYNLTRDEIILRQR